MPRRAAVVAVVACLIALSGVPGGLAATPDPRPTADPSTSPSPPPHPSPPPTTPGSTTTATSSSSSSSSHPGAPTPTPSPAAVATGLPTGDAIDQQLAQALAEQQALDAVKAQLSNEIDVAVGEQKHLGELVKANRERVATTLQQINVEQRHLEDATRRATDAHAQALKARQMAAADRAQLAEIARLEYMQSDGFVNWLLSSGSLSDFLDRAQRAHQVIDGGRELVGNLHQQELTAVAQEAEAQRQEDQARQAAAALEAQQAQLQAETAKEQDLIARLGAQTSSAAHELGNVDRQTAGVAQQVATLRIAQLDRIIADAQQAVWDDAQVYLQHNLGTIPDAPATVYSGYSGYTGAGTGPAQGPPAVAGRPLSTPTVGADISQTYGPSVNSFEPPAFGFPHFHTGLDFAAPMGTKIYAAASGVVASASPGSTGYGNHIVIATDRHLLCLYGHLQTMVVKVGDSVVQGQVIGLMGSTGNSTGPHLHFEVRLDGVPVNPAPMVGASRPGS